LVFKYCRIIFENIVLCTDHNEQKAVICLGGSITKHHAILATLLNGGAEYAVYMTTAKSSSGSLSGATTQEAKSWGKIKDDTDAVTVHGDVSILFPLAMTLTMEILDEEGLLE
jgi:deoxyhypusine synthase